MANLWNDSGDPQPRRPERSAASNSGIDRADLWGETGLPAEDNELHVLELLQRLETDSNNGASPIEEKPKQQPTKWAQWDPEITCSSCHYLNAADQKFCGHCGSSLQAEPASPPERTYPQESRMAEPRAPSTARSRSQEPPPFSFEQTPKPAAPVFAQMTPQARQRDDSDLEFLRYKTLGASAPSRSWKIPVLVLILVIAGFVGYRLYNGLSILPPQLSSNQHRPSTEASPPASAGQPGPVEADSSANQTIQETPAPQPSRTATSASVAKAKTKTPTPLRGEEPVALTAATQRSREGLSAAASAPAKPADDREIGGREELVQAERYLSPSSRDSAEAARWLWKAVGKENGRAVLLLSDLYAKGDGVAKSCDQARLLLMVAAKKGNTDAASRLRSFDSTGCR